MTYRSLNEIDQTARKAAHGCGLPWGVADEVGKAIRWLHVFGLNGVNSLIAVLGQYDHQNPSNYAPISLNGVWQAPIGILSPLLVGPSLCDCMERLKQAPVSTSMIAYPLLTTGFLGQKALNSDQAIQLKWSTVTLEFYRDQLAVIGDMTSLDIQVSESLTCARMPMSDDAAIMDAVIGGVPVEVDMWTKLENYAHLTYVEASEASRLAGAGAGLNDND